MTEVKVVLPEPQGISARAPRAILAIINLELIVRTEDDYLGETIALGYQYALKVQFARQCPSLALLYDLHTEIAARHAGSKIYDIKVFLQLKTQFSHLPADMEQLEKSVAILSAEASEIEATDEKRTLSAKILAVVFALTSVLNLGNAAHTFGENWGLIHERAKQSIEANHPGVIIDVRQISLSEPPPEVRSPPPSRHWKL